MDTLQRKVVLLERAAELREAEAARAEEERRARLTPADRRAEAQRLAGEALGKLSGAPPWPAEAVEEFWAATGDVDPAAPDRGWWLRTFVPALPEVALARGASALPTPEGNAWLGAYASAAWPRIVGDLAYIVALAARKGAESGKPPDAEALTERRLLELVAAWTDRARERLRCILRVPDFARLRKWRAWVRALLDLLEAYRAEIGRLLEAAPEAAPDPGRLEALWTWRPDLFGELRFRLEEPGEAFEMRPGAAGVPMAFPRWYLEGREEPRRAER